MWLPLLPSFIRAAVAKHRRLWGLHTTGIYFSWFWDWQVWDRGTEGFSVWWDPISWPSGSSHGRRGEGSLRVPFTRTLIPFRGISLHDPITFQTPCLLIPSPRAGGCRHSVHRAHLVAVPVNYSLPLLTVLPHVCAFPKHSIVLLCMFLNFV